MTVSKAQAENINSNSLVNNSPNIVQLTSHLYEYQNTYSYRCNVCCTKLGCWLRNCCWSIRFMVSAICIFMSIINFITWCAQPIFPKYDTNLLLPYADIKKKPGSKFQLRSTSDATCWSAAIKLQQVGVEPEHELGSDTDWVSCLGSSGLPLGVSWVGKLQRNGCVN